MSLASRRVFQCKDVSGLQVFERKQKLPKVGRYLYLFYVGAELDVERHFVSARQRVYRSTTYLQPHPRYFSIYGTFDFEGVYQLKIFIRSDDTIEYRHASDSSPLHIYILFENLDDNDDFILVPSIKLTKHMSVSFSGPSMRKPNWGPVARHIAL
ncbi:hypothetical protein K445DRAFT_121236 [Daldinia sp. EC12]|nr:hypothetical protein K445DRAFT_121236 [Daldinia sp. EC12]